MAAAYSMAAFSGVISCRMMFSQIFLSLSSQYELARSNKPAIIA